MLIKEVMTIEVETGEPEMTLQQAAQKMRDGDFGALPIAANDRLVGMLTDRDITIRAVASGLNPNQIKVREIMSPQILYCYEDQTVEEVARNLGDHQIRRLPVINRQKRLVGILSLGDMSLIKEDQKSAEEALSRISRESSQQTQKQIF